jgi:predicted DNA-binding transcriptional regulator YafY
MRRADRLFRIVQYLCARRLTTAEWLADRLEVSKRTVYRDINDLTLSGVPIEGEAGVGYALRRKLDLPPLMFDRHELTAIELGLRFVHAYTEAPLAHAATAALAKIRSALPGTTGAELPKSPLFVPRREGAREPRLNELLEAIHERRKLRLGYRDANGARTRRVVWPLGLFFWGNAWTLLSWCELRDDFRSFRLERMQALRRLDTRFEDVPGKRAIDYFRQLEKTHAVPLSDFDPEQ